MHQKMTIVLGWVASIIVSALLLHFGISKLIPMISHLHDGGGF